MAFDFARCDPALYGHLQEPIQAAMFLKFVQDFMEWVRSGGRADPSLGDVPADGLASFLMMMHKEKHFGLAKAVVPEFREDRGTMTGVRSVDVILAHIDDMRRQKSSA